MVGGLLCKNMAYKQGASLGKRLQNMSHLTLSGECRRLLRDKGYDGPRCVSEFGVGVTWFSDFMRGATKVPNADLMQKVYETLTNEPLIKKAGQEK